MINWFIAPSFIKVSYSPDGKYWVVDRDWQETKTINNLNNIFGNDFAFAQKIDFKEPRFMKTFRLFMKGPLAGENIGFGSI